MTGVLVRAGCSRPWLTGCPLPLECAASSNGGGERRNNGKRGLQDDATCWTMRAGWLAASRRTRGVLRLHPRSIPPRNRQPTKHHREPATACAQRRPRFAPSDRSRYSAHPLARSLGGMPHRCDVLRRSVDLASLLSKLSLPRSWIPAVAGAALCVPREGRAVKRPDGSKKTDAGEHIHRRRPHLGKEATTPTTTISLLLFLRSSNGASAHGDRGSPWSAFHQGR